MPPKYFLSDRACRGILSRAEKRGKPLPVFVKDAIHVQLGNPTTKPDIKLPHVFKLRSGCEGGGKGYLGQDDMSFTLSCNNDQYLVTKDAHVRKLTPVECERLMGFPDDYTLVAYRGKVAEQCPDAPRYKACGNSMCVNVMRWIGMRIDDVERGES